jgi:lysyl-tRNA synthetase class 1
VLQVPVLETHPDKGTIVYQHPTLGRTETVVSGGHCKLQWKPDWAMRWVALDVDYEMAGKDLIDSFTVGNQICTALGGTPPCQMVYEHFVDEQGRKISKSVGNGVSIEQWLRYAPAESLALFMYKKPRTAKKMFLALIPPTVEEYFDLLEKYPAQSLQERLDNPVSFIHSGTPPAPNMPISYTMLLNLVGLMHNPTAAQLLALVQRYKPDINPQDTLLQSMMAGVLNYYTDIIAPTRQPYSPTMAEQTALLDLAESLTPLTGKETPEDIQQVYYDCGKRHYAKENLKQWFGLIYKTLFGTAQGPRLGSFTQIYGVPETVALIRSAASKAQTAPLT